MDVEGEVLGFQIANQAAVFDWMMVIKPQATRLESSPYWPKRTELSHACLHVVAK